MKEISFSNRTKDQMLSSFQRLRTRYKKVKINFRLQCGMYIGYFAVTV